MHNDFPAFDFDAWAGTYDQTVPSSQGFPFDGYAQVLQTVVDQAQVKPGMSVLDLGTGTGNLAVRFAGLGCELWCTDFSPAMLARARPKLPQAHFVMADLRAEWPTQLDRTFDRIVSAYVFHHFLPEEKIRIIRRLITHLVPGGLLVIADIAFPDAAAREKVKVEAGDGWEDEFYWIADQVMPALTQTGLRVEYIQSSSCAGILTLQV